LIRELCSCGNASVLTRLPRILGNNPGVFLSDDTEVAELINSFAAFPDLGVRTAFLDSYVLLFARTPGHAAQEALLRAFRQLFENPPPSIINRLAVAQTYAFFGPGKLLQIIPILISFAPKLQAWRDVAQLAQTFLSFPADVLRPSWKAIATVFLPLFIRDAHPLAEQCQTFCLRLAGALSPEVRLSFLELVMGELSKGGWAARRIIAPLAASVATLLQPTEAKFIHAILRIRLSDPVRAVVLGVMAPLGKLRQLWALKGEIELEREVIDIFESVKNLTDELIVAAWNEAWDTSITRGLGSALPKLTQSVTRLESTTTIGQPPPRAVASLQSTLRKPTGLLGLGGGGAGLGRARRRIFQMSDMHGHPVGTISYSGPGLAGPRLTEPGLSMIGGPLLGGPGMGGGRRVERTTRGGKE
jgi:hypothetical protein